MAELKPSKTIEKEQVEQAKKSGPSGATVRPGERENKFDEEGGDQPQAPSQQAVDDELNNVLHQRHDEPHSMGSEGRPHSEPGLRQTPESFASKPSSDEHDDRNRVPVGGQHNQQNPQLKPNK